MAQHDYVIANGTGAAVRSDLNNALAAIVSNNSGSTEPATTYAYQWWADTTTNQLKLRSAANDAWIVIQELDGTMLMEDGSAASPGLAFASDLDTGFFRPGANQVAISTNGTGRLFVDASGNVGIAGTPSNPLDVFGSATLGIRYKSSGDYAKIVADNTSSTGGGYFSAYQNGNQKAIFGVTGGFLGDTSADTGLLAETGQAIRFFTNGSATEKARIDSSGRLLVGTSTVRSTGYGTPQYFQEGVNRYESIALCVNENTFAGRASVLQFARSRGGSLGSSTVVNNGDALGFISFFGEDGTDIESGAATISCEVDGTPGNNDMPGRLVFSTTADGASSPTERMRIANDGAITTFTSGASAIQACSSSTAGTTNYIFIGTYGATSTTATGTTSFLVYTNGNVQNTNNSYGAISDIKLKENIVDASSQWDDLKAIQVRNYNFKEGQTHTQLGVVAQEVELVSPGLVTESPDRDEDGNDLGTTTKSVNYSVLYMKAVKALQEAMERIETLEAKVAALESA